MILSALGNIATRDINGGRINLESSEGAVIVGGRLISSSTINIEALNNIILTNDISRADINGNISLQTVGGNIETRSIDTGTSGAIELRASGNVNFGNLQGSNVDIVSSSGELGVLSDPNIIVFNTAPVNITASENIRLTASRDLTVGNLNAATVNASSSTGSVSTGAIDTTGDVIILAQQLINTGIITVNPAATNLVNLVPTVNLDAQTNINVVSIDAGTGTIALRASNDLKAGSLQGGTVTVNSDRGTIAIGNTTSLGNINVLASENIISGNLLGTKVNVNSTSGSIDIVRAFATENTVDLTASGNVNLEALRGVGVNVTSNSGSINIGGNTDATTGNVNLTASGNVNSGELRGVGVDVTSNSGSINISGNTGATTGNVNLTASGNVNAQDLRGVGVDVTSSRGNVSTGNISASERVGIFAGNEIAIGQININPVVRVDRTSTVNINAQNDISVASINAPGGNVEIATPGLVRVTGTFDQNGTPVSISTLGDTQPGTVTIRHGGGDVNPPIPFSVGDATTNGTAGAIASNALGTITQGQSFINSYTQGNTAIVTTNQPGTNQPDTNQPGTNQPGTNQPGTNQPDTNQPDTNQPGTNQPDTNQPGTNQPGTNQPGTNQPGTNQPGTNQPGTNQPGTNQPGTNPPPPSPSGRFPLDRNRVFPDRNQPLTPEQRQNQNRISRDIAKPGDRMPPERIQSPRGLRNFINLNIRDSVIQSAFRSDIERNLEAGNISAAMSLLDKSFSQEFLEYFGSNISDELISSEEIKKKLASLGAETRTKPSLIYLFSQPEKLNLVLITSCGEMVYKSVPSANREALLKVVTQFRNEITKPGVRSTTSYLPSSQQLYKWMIAPLEDSLKKCETDTISFVVDRGLRGMPFAALHDGEQFLVEKYNLSLMPSMNLTDNRYVDLRNSQVLAMGASQFSELNPLPAVPAEIAAISREWQGVSFLNEGFTLENLKQQHQSRPFGVIHLATHGEFRPGVPSNSFIQLWDSRLRLDQLGDLRLNDPQVNMLVLSACRTAVGDAQAELGFGGLALQAGVQTAVGSLWYVSDEGTLGLMSEFYQQLKTAGIKGAALRQAQIAMLRGEVRLEGGRLRGSSRGEGVELPASLQGFADLKLSHPYYWSAFVMIGSPW